MHEGHFTLAKPAAKMPHDKQLLTRSEPLPRVATPETEGDFLAIAKAGTANHVDFCYKKMLTTGVVSCRNIKTTIVVKCAWSWMMKKPVKLGQAELEVLKYVLEHAPVTVREVADYFAAHAGLARTTVSTMIERLRTKGHLSRKKIEGLYQYSPRVSQAELMSALVKDFVDNALGGQISPFFAYLLKSGSITKTEFEELKHLVQKLEERRKET